MKQLREAKLEEIVFIDTETARTQIELKEGTPDYDAWKYKMDRSIKEQDLDIKENYKEKSALYPEFARLVCITVGRVKDGEVTLITYKDKDEKLMLEKFTSDLNMVTKSKPKTVLCGHSVKGFDIPFIFRRCLVNGIIPNKLIDVGGLKPWGVDSLDTKELWKGTGYYSASLISVCLALDVESPKSDITGAEVGEVYYSEGDKGLKRIVECCERYVLAVINVVRKCRFEEVFTKFKVVEPKKPMKESLVDRIARKGEIDVIDREEVLRKTKDSSYREKEKMIKILKSALIITKAEFPEDLELEILKG